MKPTEAYHDLRPKAEKLSAPLDWPWQLARRRRRSRVRAEVSPLVREAVAYLRGDAGPRTASIRQAEALHREKSLLRWEVEARLLAGQGDGVIAPRCGLGPAGVCCYEGLFFAVRYRLHATEWLLDRTAGDCRFTGFRRHQLRELWNWYDLSCGPAVLDEVVRDYHSHAAVGEKPGLHVYLREGADTQRPLQVQIALACIPLTAEGDQRLVEFGLRFRQIQAMSDHEHAETLLARLQADVIACGRAALAGKRPANPLRQLNRLMKSKSRHLQFGHQANTLFRPSPVSQAARRKP